MTMVNNVIGVVNYVIAARPSLLNFMIADTQTNRRNRKRQDNRASPVTRVTSIPQVQKRISR